MAYTATTPEPIAEIVEVSDGGALLLRRRSITHQSPGDERLLDALDDLLAQMSNDPARSIVGVRALAALGAGLARLDGDGLRRAGSGVTDHAVLVKMVIELPLPDTTSGTDDPDAALAGALLLGKQREQEQLAAEGGSLGPVEVGRRLHLSRQAINLRREKGQLLGLDTGRHGYRYPAWQFTEDGTLPGLEETLAALRNGRHGDRAQLRFFLTPHLALGDRRPLDALQSGDLDAVLGVAADFGEEGGS